MAPSSSDNSGGDDIQVPQAGSRSQAGTPKPPTTNFVQYPYPDTQGVLGFLETLPGAKEESRRCIAKLLDYRAVRTHARFPRGQSASVLVPLFVGRSGDLYVLLSRRSDALKTFAGDTALPGGKVDAQDVTIEDTARREAFEEIGLPQDKERVPLLCVMEPHLAKGETLVIPVVVLVIDNSLQPNLNSSEVTSIFAQPLASFLSSTPYLSGNRMTDPNEPFHTFQDLPWSKGGTIRLHRFLTGREREGVKPVFGLTASILIKTATIGYGHVPDFEVQPPDAPTPVQQIIHALLTLTNPLRRACEREGIDADKTVHRLLHPPMLANAPRTIEWEKIGVEWMRLMEREGNAADFPVAANATVTKARESTSSSSERNPRGDGLQEEEPEKKGEERVEQRRDATPNMAELCRLLDETRDMLNERMKEIRGDEKKLAEARKIYPVIMEQVKKSIENARKADGELDLEKLMAMIPKEVRNGLKGSFNAGKEGAMRWIGQGRGEGVERGNEGTQGSFEEMKMDTGQGDGGHNSEQALHTKRDVKL